MMLIENIVPTRSFNLLYIILDSLFIIFFLFLLFYKKRYVTLLWSLFGGILYFIVDFGYFYLISGSRTITINSQLQGPLMTGLVLLWMSLSYGITNFAYIFLFLNKDKYLKEWIFLIISWWLIVPTISSIGGEATITTSRTTGQYHGAMAIILLIGYFSLIVYNLFNKKGQRIPILKLNLIGITVQFGWEFALLINGIRPMNEASFATLIINSLIETNLGMPIIFVLHKLIYKRVDENMKQKKAVTVNVEKEQEEEIAKV